MVSRKNILDLFEANAEWTKKRIEGQFTLSKSADGEITLKIS